MKVEFIKLFDELKSIQFESNIHEYETESNAIIQALRSVISKCITKENASKETIEEYFKNALDLSIELNTSEMGKMEESIYSMLRDPDKIKHVLCYQKKDPDLTIEQQEAFRNCVRDLYPKITEAAQNIKERIEMPPTQIQSTQEREPKKTVKWADRCPSTKSSSSSISF